MFKQRICPPTKDFGIIMRDFGVFLKGGEKLGIILMSKRQDNTSQLAYMSTSHDNRGVTVHVLHSQISDL